ncbi:DUF1697 domain-containing protein [Streptococcus mutans]|uniref:DUF1697 domain-containing protein n=1 Tax=Streptococcus mutans TaxID=1309 RepID=UPI0015D0E92C|nr:DUF1697 domain-containing protein [Streptococcus mutans]
MAYLREILEFTGLQSVQTYIQSGNIICETDLSDEKFNQLIDDTIKIKPNAQLVQIAAEQSFDDSFDISRIPMMSGLQNFPTPNYS